MKYNIIFLVLTLNIIISSCGFTEEIEINAVGEYTIGDSESKLIGKQRAIDEAMRYASEKAGVYIESYSKTTMGVLTTDEVKIISANLIKLKKEPEIKTSLTSSGDIKIVAEIVASIETDNISNEIHKRISENKELEMRIKNLEIEKESNQKELEEIRKQASSVKIYSEEEKMQRIVDIFLNCTNYDDVVSIMTDGMRKEWDKTAYGHFKNILKNEFGNIISNKLIVIEKHDGANVLLYQIETKKYHELDLFI